MRKFFLTIICSAMTLAIVLTSCRNPYSNDDVYSNENGTPPPREPVYAEGHTVAAQLAWVQTFGQTGGYYLVTAHLANEVIYATQVIRYGNRQNITVRILGQNSGRTLSLNGPIGSMFLVEKPAGSVTLILENITLVGYPNNRINALVEVNEGGTLEMRTGSVITGNMHDPAIVSLDFQPAGVEVTGGTFTMRGTARIHNNHGRRSGAVSLDYSILIMKDDALIAGNSAGETGGGISISRASVFMYNDAAIIGNHAAIYGGGVVVGGSLNMHGNSVRISDNTAASGAGGVLVSWFQGSTINISGGTIYGLNEPLYTNTIAAGNGAALRTDGGIVRVVNYTACSSGGRGTIVPSSTITTFIPTTDNTIRVRNNGTYASW